MPGADHIFKSVNGVFFPFLWTIYNPHLYLLYLIEIKGVFCIDLASGF